MEATEKRILKIGDKLCQKVYRRFVGGIAYYNFSEVVRVTKTQAVLDSGIKLLREPRFDGFVKKYVYETYGDSYRTWELETRELVEEAEEFKRISEINSWFNCKKFTQEEIIIIHNTLTDGKDK